MKTIYLVASWVVTGFGLVALQSCFGTDGASTPGPTQVIDEAGQRSIVDRTGKKWDVTFGYTQFGMQPKKYQFGLGKNAIVPIINPAMAAEGEPFYPSSTDSMRVMGVRQAADIRAYSIATLTRHEVVDDVVNGQPLAVAY